MYLHLPERVLRKFRYLQGMFRDPTFVAPSTILRRDVDGIFVEYHKHLVPEDVYSVLTPRP